MLLSTEGIDVPLAQLTVIAERELHRNAAALRVSCAAFATGQPITACIAKMQANKTPGSPLDSARTQVASLKAFVVDKQLVSIPGPEQAEVEETHRTRVGTLRRSRFRGPTKEACLPSIRSRHQTRSGRRQSAMPTSRAEPTCCSSRLTRSGLAICCSSCTQGDRRPSWPRSSWVMPSAKAGRTTQKR